MKIAYVLMQYPVATQTFALSDVAALRALGHEVSIHCLRPPSARQRELLALYAIPADEVRNVGVGTALVGVVDAGAQAWRARRALGPVLRPLLRRPRSLLKALTLLPGAGVATRRVVAERPDVVHAFWGHYPSLVPLLVAHEDPSIRTSVFVGAYDMMSGFPAEVVADVVDHRVTHSAANVEPLRARGVDRPIALIRRGIPTEELAAVAGEQERVRHRLCTASALVPEKNVDQVVRAFAHLRESCPEATLTVIGDGPEAGALRRLADELGVASATTFTGYVPRHEVFAAMGASEVFVFLSTKPSDRLPNVVKEAMFAGCCCVVADGPGVDELIPDEGVGIVVPAGAAPEDLADRLRVALQDEAALAALGRRAAGLIAEQFTSEAAMRAYVELWSADR